MRPKSGQPCQETTPARLSADRQGDVDSLAASPFRSQALTAWMQTVGAALLVVRERSLTRVLVAAQDSRSAHGLLYLAAVRDHGRGPEHRREQVGDEARQRPRFRVSNFHTSFIQIGTSHFGKPSLGGVSGQNKRIGDLARPTICPTLKYTPKSIVHSS